MTFNYQQGSILSGNASIGSSANITTANSGTISIGSNSNSTSSNGAVWIGPTQTTTAASNSYIWQQVPSTISMSGSVSYNNNNEKYAVFKLPHNKLPESVYVSGRMLTLGLLGTDVEVAFTGDNLIFAPGVLTAIQFNGKITLILEYHDAMYHYNVGHNFNIIEFEEGTNKVKTTLLSKIKRGEKCLDQEI